MAQPGRGAWLVVVAELTLSLTSRSPMLCWGFVLQKDSVEESGDR